MKSDGKTLKDHLDAMVENGINGFDPVRFSYIESLARRAARMPEAVRQQVEKRAVEALADYETCFKRAQKEAKRLLGQMASAPPEALEPLQRLYSANDLKGVQRMARKLRRSELRSPLGLLVEQLSGETRLAFESPLPPREDETLHETERFPARTPDFPPGSGISDLKSYRLFKETWARHYSDRLVSNAVRELPKNPGPLNSQMLITRSLVIMRNISPDYLKRFVSYVDTLLWLENATGKRISHEDRTT